MARWTVRAGSFLDKYIRNLSGTGRAVTVVFNGIQKSRSKVRVFFSVVYLTLTLNSPVKIYSLIHANKKIHINNAKYTTGTRKSPTRKIPTWMISPAQFSPRITPTRTIPTRKIPTKENSHPG